MHDADEELRANQNMTNPQVADKAKALRDRRGWREFIGNENYVRFFNQQTRYLPLDEKDETTSRISNHENSNTIGVLWSYTEKEKFFNLLSRYSIHNYDLIAEELGRSEIDVLNYYQVLKTELIKLKNSKSNFHKLVRMDEMPIAYEMSSHFIRMEEYQAQQMCLLERKRRMDRERDSKKVVKDSDDGTQLIDPDRWNTMAEFYKHSKFMDSELNQAPVFIQQSYDYFENYAKIVIKELMIDLITNHRILLSLDDDDRDWVNITKKDVLNSTRRVLGGSAYNNLNFIEKFMITVLDSSGKELDAKRILKKKKSVKGIGILQDDKNAETDAVTSSADEDVDTSEGDDEDAIFETQKSIDIEDIRPEPTVSTTPFAATTKALLNANGKRDHDPFVEEDTLSIIDNPLAEDIFMKESRILNDKDLKESRYHEHIVLTLLSTYGDPVLNQDEELKEKYYEYEEHMDSKDPCVQDCYEKGSSNSSDLEDEDDEIAAEEEEEEEEMDDDERALWENERQNNRKRRKLNNNNETVVADPEMILMHFYDYASY